MKYKIGLDIGITSVGWAVVELNSKDEPFKILDMGVRIFDRAENPDGSSLALPRRQARGTRRRLRRRKHRLERIRNLIIDSSILTEDELKGLYNKNNLEDIYKIRVKALDEKLEQEDWARLLIHLAQRRGFKSNRKSDKKDRDSGKLLKAVESNHMLLEQKGYRTIGEMLLLDTKFKDHKRNKGDDYSHTIGRDLMLEEVKYIFEQQRKFGNIFASSDIEEKYIEIVFSQRSFELGPGEPSKYAGNQIEKMIGNCRFEEGEKRAPKAAFSTEYAILLQNINNLKIKGLLNSRFLSDEERKKLIELAKMTKDLKYTKIRKELGLKDHETFANLSYGNKEIKEVEDKTKFDYLNNYHKIKTALNKVKKDRIKDYTIDQLNAIGYAFTIYKTDSKIKEYLSNYNIDNKDIEILLENITSFSKFSNLSIKVYKNITPYLEQGIKYNEACEKAGYDFRGHSGREKSFILPSNIEELEEITSPVVLRAVSQTRKVINAIIRKYNQSPAFISIELAREMAKNFDDRQKIRKSMEENAAYNKQIKEEIQQLGIINPSGHDIVKYKLWKEQDGRCAYSLEPLKIERLFEIGYSDVDHIIPYSKCFDDSYSNKVVVRAKENRQKGNRLPLQYLDESKKDAFKIWVNSTIKDRRKKENLLKEYLTEEELKSLKERNLNDTKHISRFMYNYLNDYLEFAELESGKKKRVTAVNGRITSFLRKRWGISKIREDGDLHHAVDALVVACTTQAMVNKVSNYYKYQENKYAEHGQLLVNKETGEILDKFPQPWPEFRKELEIRLMDNPMEFANLLSNYDGEGIKPVFVSRMPRRKVTGAAHKETIYSPRLKNEGLLLIKRDLTELKLDKNGEIEGYYKPESDRRLYEALKARLQEFNGNAKKAFAEPFHKPTKTGKPGPIVKKVKIKEKSNLNVEINNGKGIALNGDMVRIDVFYVENEGYYFVPIYVSDTVKETLPNKAVVARKKYNEWKEMKEEDFIFSLYPNDLIKVKTKKDIKFSLVNKQSTLPKEIKKNEFYAYYVKAGIGDASISIINHDNTYTIKSMGVKTLVSLEKYNVDVLGNYHKVRKEKRMPFL